MVLAFKGDGGKSSKKGTGATEKRPKNSTVKPLPEGQREKDRKIAKKYQKMALLSLYLLYLHHV